MAKKNCQALPDMAHLLRWVRNSNTIYKFLSYFALQNMIKIDLFINKNY